MIGPIIAFLVAAAAGFCFFGVPIYFAGYKAGKRGEAPPSRASNLFLGVFYGMGHKKGRAARSRSLQDIETALRAPWDDTAPK